MTQQILVGADLKQAEAMVVAWEASDPLLIECFETNRDAHRAMGCVFFYGWRQEKLPPDELMMRVRVACDSCDAAGVKKCNHSERHISKVGGHAFRYLMGEAKFLRLLAQSGVYKTYAEAKTIRNLAITPSIRRWQSDTWDTLARTHTLTNSVGLVREFYGFREEWNGVAFSTAYDPEIHRAALSWRAQSVVSYITTIAMTRLYNAFLGGPSRVVTQTHDSVLISTPLEELDSTIAQIRTAFNVPLIINNRPLLIPIEVSVGPSWGELKEVA